MNNIHAYYSYQKKMRAMPHVQILGVRDIMKFFFIVTSNIFVTTKLSEDILLQHSFVVLIDSFAFTIHKLQKIC
jgi:hypothetical protein